jgi:thiol-disulfide isomerase/thioredoxin
MITIKYVGASWCKPCQTVKPQIIELCKQFNIQLTIIDYDEMEESEQSLIKKLPSIFLFDENKQIDLITTNHVDSLKKFLINAYGLEHDDDF